MTPACSRSMGCLRPGKAAEACRYRAPGKVAGGLACGRSTVSLDFSVANAVSRRPPASGAAGRGQLRPMGRGLESEHRPVQPLRIPVFRRFWVSSMASNFGGLIQTVAAAWMMTTLTGDARMVGLVQTCATLPMMMISLPAGALADIYERRVIMLIAQSAMLVVAFALAVLTGLHFTTPLVLLVATFLIGGGTALNGPAWQASMQDQVPREAFEAAASINSVGFNVARSLGPAIGGLI